ncbi:MAG TPA: STM4015 family protein [Actinoplanes sp.]|nr:STM4015 family protein [Actinoplanes sp.]
MDNDDHLSSFAGLPTLEYYSGLDTPDPAAVAWRLSWGGLWANGCPCHTCTLDRRQRPEIVGRTCDMDLDGFVEQWGDRATTLIISDGDDSAPDYEQIAAALTRMPKLRALFVGDVFEREAEISWIHQSDLSVLLAAAPTLEHLQVRGSAGLKFPPIRHDNLRRLILEGSGLPGPVARGVGASDLPALEHLELWLGTEDYHGSPTIVDDLAGVLSGQRLPALRHLGLRNAELSDEVAAAVAIAPVIARLDELDLSLGILSDTGAEALLTGQPLTHLRRLNLSHHFLTDDMAAHLDDSLPDVDVDTSDPRLGADPDYYEEDERYIAVSE